VGQPDLLGEFSSGQFSSTPNRKGMDINDSRKTIKESVLGVQFLALTNSPPINIPRIKPQL
jgi:hypothetical protein